MILLADYIEAAVASPWAWGRMDCCFFAGDWIAQRTGRDAMNAYRGTYDSAVGARRLIVRRGGLQAMVAAEMIRCGFGEAACPDDGDIAVVPLVSDDERAVAQASVMIRQGPWWVGRTLGGIAGLDVRPPVAWRIA